MAVASQNKRKTNHERFEEDRNKLAIGYRLSAIGYRLILGLLVSAFAVTAFAAECKVNNSDISDEYVGGCLNGLAHGNGKAKGRDTYEGEFKQGNKHGKGKYIWASGTRYAGNFLDDRVHGLGKSNFESGDTYTGEYQAGKIQGFGEYTFRRNQTKLIKMFDYESKGKWIGDIFVVQGMFEDGRLILSCTSPKNCKQDQANGEPQEGRGQADRD